GASSAAVASGSARNTTSASRNVSGDSGVMSPFHTRASAGSFRAIDVPEDIAAVRVTDGWRDSSRSSSWPVYPVAPAIATFAGVETPVRREEDPASVTVCMEKYIYTRTAVRINRNQCIVTRLRRISRGRVEWKAIGGREALRPVT